MANYWDSIQRSKEAHRARLAALSPDERMKLIERLHDQGVAMRHSRMARVREPGMDRNSVIIVNTGQLGVADTPQIGTIQLNVLGANPTFVTVVTANSNSTSAVENTFIEPSGVRTR